MPSPRWRTCSSPLASLLWREMTSTTRSPPGGSRESKRIDGKAAARWCVHHRGNRGLIPHILSDRDERADAIRKSADPTSFRPPKGLRAPLTSPASLGTGASSGLARQSFQNTLHVDLHSGLFAAEIAGIFLVIPSAQGPRDHLAFLRGEQRLPSSGTGRMRGTSWSVIAQCSPLASLGNRRNSTRRTAVSLPLVQNQGPQRPSAHSACARANSLMSTRGKPPAPRATEGNHASSRAVAERVQ